MIKPRRVFVLLELETAMSLAKLRASGLWIGSEWSCVQVQANVAQQPKKQRARKKA